MAYGTEATGVATPRANWCPGDIINPIDVPLPSLMPGSHEVSVSITGIAGSPARWWTSVHVLTHP
jgi:hypothetical protein